MYSWTRPRFNGASARRDRAGKGVAARMDQVRLVLTKITVPLEEQELEELKKRASDFGVSPEALVPRAMQELPERSDQEFPRAMKHVLGKK